MKRPLSTARVWYSDRCLRSVNPPEIWTAVRNHALGRWGRVSRTRRALNSMRGILPVWVYSRHEDNRHVVFWVATTPGREETFVMLDGEVS